MPAPNTSPTDHIARARALCNGASVSLEHVMAALESRSFVVRVEQQADWIIGELEHAVSQIRQARAASQAVAQEWGAAA